jgi:glycosyltransferase involved in cell wall biosynthesis
VSTQSISIIIPALNEEHYLPRLLDSIAKQSFEGEMEVIVVDGGSEDKTLEKAHSYSDTVSGLKIVKTTRGIAHQRNYGATKATSSNLVFLDADTELPAGAIQKLASKFNYRGDFVAIPVLLPYDGKTIDMVAGMFAYLYFMLVRFTAPIISGMCIVTTKTNHERIGGFNEAALYAEDIDYGLRSVRQGAKYRIFFGVLVRASARRLDHYGRWRLGITWLRWHHQTAKHGAITSSEDEYSFGDWKGRL